MKAYSDVIIVGAGAAGLFCAALLARKLEGQVSITVLEKNNRIGKKLSATGNGRCNFTNLHMGTDCYYGDSQWLQKVLEKVTPQMVIDIFHEFGVFHREKDGYVYPHTNQAGTVIHALEKMCERDEIEIELDCFVKGIYRKSKKQGFEVVTSKGTIQSRVLVVATGGAAGKEAGGDASGYEIVKKLGMNVSPVYPGLTGLKCEGKLWKKVAGTRIQGTFSLLVDGKEYKGETGEIQIVKDGVSGIPVFQMCRVAAQALEHGHKVQGKIDFVPALSKEELSEWLSHHGIEGIVPQKWIDCIKTKNAHDIKNYMFDIVDTFGMERAQVTAGGVLLSQVNAQTMQVSEIPHLYLLGELLDIDGKCGGYNLHFAWSTALLAAKEIIMQIEQSK